MNDRDAAATMGDAAAVQVDAIVQVDGLRVSTDDGRTLVDDLSFTVGAGERFGLIGESGSGKSLTALALVGLVPDGLRASGSVVVGGRQAAGADERALRGIRGRVASVVFQDPLASLDPLMRLGRQLAEPIARHQGLRGKALAAAVRAAMADVRLGDPDRIAAAYPHEISGGQRQRVAIAMALACQPRLLIADEPTTALDVTVQSDVLDLIDRAVTERGTSLLFVSHDLAVVSRMTDRVVVLQRGSAVESGTIAGLLAHQDDPYTAELVASARSLDRALEVS
jgi:peptide/nickel transport system ATP-binding protein